MIPTDPRTPKPTKPKPAKAKPAASGSNALAALMPQPINYGALGKTARASAATDTGSAIAQTRAQQDAINRRAALQSQEIHRAGVAAAAGLTAQDLGGKLETSLRTSAKDQAALASGFSGDLQTLVGGEAAKVQAGLDAVGAPGGVPTTAAQAGNTVYGLGGSIPANAMLQAAPFAVAQARNAPNALLGESRQLERGALNAGRQAAGELDADIAGLIAKRPELARKYLESLTKAADDRRQDEVGNVFKAIGVQQKDADLAADIDYKNATLALRQASDETRAAYQAGQLTLGEARARISAINAETSRINARTSASRAGTSARQGQARIAQGQNRVDQGQARIDQARDRARGYTTDEAGAKHALPGFRLNPKTGDAVKVSTTSAAGKSGLSTTKYASLKKDAAKAADLFYYGKAPDPQKVAALMRSQGLTEEEALDRVSGIAGIDYNAAIRRLIHTYSLTRADAAELLNDFYAPGERGRPMTAAGKRRNAAAIATVKKVLSFSG